LPSRNKPGGGFSVDRRPRRGPSSLEVALPNRRKTTDGPDCNAAGAKLVTVFGIGRVCHIAFWEPHFAAEFAGEAEWKAQTHRLGARLHPLTVEQNAITSFRSRTTLVPSFANTIGPALFLSAGRIIGGADGALGRGMQWQGLSLRMTLLHEPTPWVPSSYMPTLPGQLFYLRELAGPLEAECH
jgi:glucosamine-6-phosphate deaminase